MAEWTVGTSGSLFESGGCGNGCMLEERERVREVGRWCVMIWRRKNGSRFWNFTQSTVIDCFLFPLAMKASRIPIGFTPLVRRNCLSEFPT